jgi:hypothetical protein
VGIAVILVASETRADLEFGKKRENKKVVINANMEDI